MSFAGTAAAEAPDSAACALALEILADTSAVDIVGGVVFTGVSPGRGRCRAHRVAPSSAPAGQPRTGHVGSAARHVAHLVVHDPTVARSPGAAASDSGSCGRSRSLEGPDGAPIALGLRRPQRRGYPAPSGETMRALADAGRADPAQEDREAHSGRAPQSSQYVEVEPADALEGVPAEICISTILRFRIVKPTIENGRPSRSVTVPTAPLTSASRTSTSCRRKATAWRAALAAPRTIRDEPIATAPGWP